jgi:hypothetical protein
MMSEMRAILGELRRSPRFPVKADVLYHWREAEKDMQHGFGFTENISRNGLFVHGNVCPPEGAVVSVEIAIPPTGAGSKLLVLESGGTVVWVCSPAGPEEGFGARVEHALFYQTPENELEPVN